jgi:Putative peptidoglycan binding domain
MPRNAVALLLFAVPATLLAHGGGLDANGCHTNRKTGDYHCHRAPAPPPIPAPRAAPPKTSSGNSPYSSPLTAPGPGTAISGAATERQLVLTAQLLLVALGYSPGRQDGVVTVATTAAIRQFQTDRSLEPDGFVSGPLLVRLAEQVALQAKIPSP